MLRKRLCWITLVTLAAGLVCLNGCGPSRPTTVPVDGTVTLDGEPLEGASVVFTPEGEGKVAVGTTDSAGKFTLTTYTPGDGAVVGTHKVTVRKTAGGGEEPSAAPESEDAEDAEALEAPLMGEDVGATAEAEWITPKKYSNPASTPLTVEVERGMDPVTLDLSSTS